MNYFDMWKAAWDFQKKYVEIQDNEEYWDSIVAESSLISKQFNSCKFINDLLLAVMSEIERQYKEMKDNADR